MRVAVDQWYVAPAGGNTEGPYTTEDLIVKIRRGLVDRESQVCNANGSVWVAMADVPQFERALRRAPTILKAPGALQPSKPPPDKSAPKAAAPPAAAPPAAAPPAAAPRAWPRPPPAPVRTKVSQPPPGAARAKVSHPPMGPVRSRVAEPPAEPQRSKLTDPPEPSELTDPPEAAAPATLPAMPPLGPPRRDDGEDTIPPPAAEGAPVAAPVPEPAAPAFEIVSEPPVPAAESPDPVAQPSAQEPSRTDETVPGRARRGQPSTPLPWMVTGVGTFVMLTGAIITLAADSLKGLVIMLLGLGAISIGGQLGQGARSGRRS